MKKITLGLLFFVASLAFAAGSPKTFVGRYHPDKNACKGDLRLFERVYVKWETSSRLNPKGALTITAYGSEEPASLEIPLGQGVRQAPGSPRHPNDEVTNSWNTEIHGRTLYSEQRMTRAAMDFDVRTRTKLTRIEDGLIVSVTSQERGQKPVQETYCELVEY